MDHDLADTLMQVLGLGLVIGPMAVLIVVLTLASRRRQARELAELAEPPAAPEA